MASSADASPLAASPTGYSPQQTSYASAGHSPRSASPSSASSHPPKPSRHTCSMVLSWLHTAVPAILQKSGHDSHQQQLSRTDKQKQDAASILALTLNDGVVLADILSFLDQNRLPNSAILRASPRNARSTPIPTSSNHNLSNIDSRQLEIQYNKNTRRAVEAVKKILIDVRTYSGFPHRPGPGAVDNFIGDVASVSPSIDLRPTIRLAKLVIATAVYGPRHNEFRQSIWCFPSKETHTTFHDAMSDVANAVALPPPDVLYAAGPPPSRQFPMPMPMPMHMPPPHPPTSAPMPQPLPNQFHPIYHQPPNTSAGAARPPLSPNPPQTPLPLSPRGLHISKPKAASASNSSHSQPHASSRKPPTPPQHQQYPNSSNSSTSSKHQYSHSSSQASPKQKRSSGQSPQHQQKHARVNSPKGSRSNSNHSSSNHSSPRMGSSSSPKQQQSPSSSSPKIQSSRKTASDHRTSRSPQKQKYQEPGRNSRASSSSSRQSNSSRGSERVGQSSGGRDSAASSSSNARRVAASSSAERQNVAPLSRNQAPDAKTAAMKDERMQTGRMTAGGIATFSGMEEGMDGRKFSMVTDDSTSPHDDSSRGDAADSSGDLRAVASGARPVVESNIMQPMGSIEDQRHMEREHRSSSTGSREVRSPRYDDTSEERERDSKRSSEEFYTPNELSPTPTSEVASSSSKTGVPQLTTAHGMRASPIDPAPSDGISSPAMSQMGWEFDQKDSKVDETVRQSVTTSITEHISRGSSQNRPKGPSPAASTSGRKASAPRLFSSESNSSSMEMNNPSYMLSPSTSDAPSPSNQWHMSQGRGAGHDILSPMAMFSPPGMPPSQPRTAMSTQMTPPIYASPSTKPQIFKSPSPQFSVSSAGGQSGSEGTDVGVGTALGVPPPIQPKRLSDSSLKGCSQSQAQNRGSVSSTQSAGLPPRPPKPSAASGQRRSTRSSPSTTAMQMTPSPPIQVSRNSNINDNANSSATGKSKVSFAKTIISPGGNAHPLGEPLRRNVPKSPVKEIPPQPPIQVRTSTRRSSERKPDSFALPPVATAERIDKGQAQRHGEKISMQKNNNNTDQARYELAARIGRSRPEQEKRSMTYSHESSYTTAQTHLEEDSGELHDDGPTVEKEEMERDEEEEYEREAEDQEQQVEEEDEEDEEENYDHEDDAEDDHGSFSEQQPFKRVEEVVVYNSDEEKVRLAQGKTEDYGQSVKHAQGRMHHHMHHEDPQDDDGVYDEDEEYGDDSAIMEDDVSPRDEEDDVEPAAEDEFPKAHMDLERDLDSIDRTNIQSYSTGQSGATTSDLYQVDNDIHYGDDHDHESAHIPGYEEFLTPPSLVNMRSSSTRSKSQGDDNFSDVPPTPPSPPDIESLKQSISQSNMSTVHRSRKQRRQQEQQLHEIEEDDYNEEDDAPVSTMEPSAGLFQKLITLWQSADEKGIKPEGMRFGGNNNSANSGVGVLDDNTRYVQEVSVSHITGGDSNHPSGNTDLEQEVSSRRGRTSSRVGGRRSVSSSDTSRGRPKAMRLPPNVVTSPEFAAAAGTSSTSRRREELEEGTSMASFSDAFSSDDKDRGWAESERAHFEGPDWEEAMRGDNRAGLPLSPRQGLPEQRGRRRSNTVARSEGGKSMTEDEGSGTETEPGIGPYDVDMMTGANRRSGPNQRVQSSSKLPNTSSFYEDSVSGGESGSVVGRVATDGHHIKVDRHRLDWLTKQLLAARDEISRKELQMQFAATEKEVLVLEKQDAESLVNSMKKILTQREHEVKSARERLSVAIQNTPTPTEEISPDVNVRGAPADTRTVSGNHHQHHHVTTTSARPGPSPTRPGPSTITTATPRAAPAAKTTTAAASAASPNPTATTSGGGDRDSAGASGMEQQQRVSVESRSSAHGSSGNSRCEQLIVDGHAKLHQRFDECNVKQEENAQAFTKEMRDLWNEVQRAMLEKMSEMTERRDEELEVLKRELSNRERLIYELKESSSDLVDQNRAIQAEASELRLKKEKSAHRYEMEMAHVTAKVELVDEFSKKLHDNFRETENLRQQVLQYQDKLSHIAGTSGVSQRQIKELREAVSKANNECAKFKSEAERAKRDGMEAVRKAEELEGLAAHSTARFPDRQDSGSFSRSHDPVRPAGHNRPGGVGINTRYHQTRVRGMRDGTGGPAQKAWSFVKDKIGGIVTGKDGSGSRRRIHAGGHYRGGGGGGSSGTGADGMRGGGMGSQSSGSRSRASRDDEMIMGGAGRSSHDSESLDGGRSGGTRSNRSGEGGGASNDGGSSYGGRGGGGGGMILEDENSGDDGYGYDHQQQQQYQHHHGEGNYGQNEIGRLQATDF